MIDDTAGTKQSADLQRANALMIEALRLLDRHRHEAAPFLDHAIVRLAIRGPGEGMPAEFDIN